MGHKQYAKVKFLNKRNRFDIDSATCANPGSTGVFKSQKLNIGKTLPFSAAHLVDWGKKTSKTFNIFPIVMEIEEKTLM